MTLTLLSQLHAIRTLVDGLIGALELEAQAPVDATPLVTGNGCAHPAHRQVDGSTLGGPASIVCLDCGEERLGTVDR